jgi:hypothetical protein
MYRELIFNVKYPTRSSLEPLYAQYLLALAKSLPRFRPSFDEALTDILPEVSKEKTDTSSPS